MSLSVNSKSLFYPLFTVFQECAKGCLLSKAEVYIGNTWSIFFFNYYLIESKYRQNNQYGVISWFCFMMKYKNIINILVCISINTVFFRVKQHQYTKKKSNNYLILFNTHCILRSSLAPQILFTTCSQTRSQCWAICCTSDCYNKFYI